MKRCTLCKQEKPPTDFHRNARRKDGLGNVCKPCACSAAREWRRNNLKRERNGALVRLYGISLGDYERMVAKQEGRCAICNVKTKLFVDHCHTTNGVRGLLCLNCNNGLGHFRDNPESLINAANYVKNLHR